jgi:hypothetical protein
LDMTIGKQFVVWVYTYQIETKYSWLYKIRTYLFNPNFKWLIASLILE